MLSVIEDQRNSRHDRAHLRKRTWPNLISYNAALSTCSKGEQWQMALSLLSKMARETIEADTISFNSALSSCCEALQWRRVFQLLQELPSKHMMPDCIGCLACLCKLCSLAGSGHVDAAHALERQVQCSNHNLLATGALAAWLSAAFFNARCEPPTQCLQLRQCHRWMQQRSSSVGSGN